MIADRRYQPDQEADDVERAWAEEIRTRLAEVDSGVVTPIPWPEARRRIFAAAAGHREGLEERVAPTVDDDPLLAAASRKGSR